MSIKLMLWSLCQIVVVHSDLVLVQTQSFSASYFFSSMLEVLATFPSLKKHAGYFSNLSEIQVIFFIQVIVWWINSDWLLFLVLDGFMVSFVTWGLILKQSLSPKRVMNILAFFGVIYRVLQHMKAHLMFSKL